MTTYDASLDYQSTISTRPEETRAPEQTGNSYDVDRRRSRIRFLRFLLINVLIWPIIVFVGYQISESHSPEVSETVLKSSGVQKMTADQLGVAVAAQNRPVFWLGRLAGDLYSDNTTEDGIDVISYLPQDANPAYLNQLDLVIKTYRDGTLFSTQLRPLAGSNNAVVETVGNVMVTYDPSSPDHSVVTFKDKPQIVAIDYPVFQNLSTLVMDAQNLEPIK